MSSKYMPSILDENIPQYQNKSLYESSVRINNFHGHIKEKQNIFKNLSSTCSQSTLFSTLPCQKENYCDQQQDQQTFFEKQKRQKQGARIIIKKQKPQINNLFNQFIKYQNSQLNDSVEKNRNNFQKFFFEIANYKMNANKSQFPQILNSKSMAYSQCNQFQHKMRRQIKDSQVHNGFNCNGCGQNPIKGIRMHCSSNQCSDDYDLCKKCFQKGHQHQMNQVKNEKAENYAKAVIKSLFRSKR